jgi:hypothetical protein
MSPEPFKALPSNLITALCDRRDRNQCNQFINGERNNQSRLSQRPMANPMEKWVMGSPTPTVDETMRI